MPLQNLAQNLNTAKKYHNNRSAGAHSISFGPRTAMGTVVGMTVSWDTDALLLTEGVECKASTTGSPLAKSLIPSVAANDLIPSTNDVKPDHICKVSEFV